jgi:hypothetical protein
MSQSDDSPFGYAWLLSEAVAAFSADSLPYCLIGAVALGAHGRPRATQDLDLLILAERIGCESYLAPLRTRGFEIASTWQDANPMARDVVLRVLHPSAQDFPLDLIFATSALHHAVLNRRRPQLLGEIEVSVGSPEDLILLKLAASRPRDFEDVASIVLNPNLQLDLNYLWSWAERLGLQSELHYVLLSAKP